MKIKRLISILLSVVLLLISLPLSVNAVNDKAEYVEGEIIISSPSEIEDIDGQLFTASNDDTAYIDFEDVGIESISEVENYTEEENVYVAEVDGNVEKICKELNESGEVTAEPNYILHTCDFTMPNEVKNNLNIYKNYQSWYLNTIMQVPEAWQTHEVTGSGVTIAIIDDGYYLNHNDMSANLWLNSNGTVGWNVVENNDDISPIYRETLVTDTTSSYYNTYNFSNTVHGSNVAGVIGMRSNGSGGIGAAYGATLMLIQAAHYISDTSNPSFSASDIVSAIDYARTNGADIINLSLGTASNSSSISSAVTRAYNAGILVVAAAGNGNSSGVGIASSTQKYYPAAYSNVLGVMAIDKTNTTKLSSFSNYDTNGGQYYEIAAPGVSIVGCGLTSTSYSISSGTSQASPLVAAVAALYMEKYPDKTISELREDLLTSCTDLVYANTTTSYTFKSLNALKFLNYCTPPEIVVNLNTCATLDGNYLYGLDEGFTDISSYITVTDGTGTLQFTPTENGCGTGSVIDIYTKNGTLYRTINVVIFGDINGDCTVDGQDALLIECMYCGFNSAFTTCQKYAADVTFDEIVAATDFGLVFDASIGLEYITQSK